MWSKVVFGWGLDHFQQKNGKYLGIFRNGLTSFIDLYQRYGFTNLFVSSYEEKQNAITAGFKIDGLMGGVTNTNSVISFGQPGLGYYHFDEPFEHGYSLSHITNLSTFISSYSNNSKLMLSSYSQTNFPYYYAVAPSNTYIMCDQYYDGSIWYGHDQRSYWTAYKNYYLPSNVFTHWISARIDGEQGDFPILFDHANYLNINILWLFEGDCYNQLSKINFCYEAWRKGWLRQFQMRLQIIMHCDDCPEGCDPNDPEGWYQFAAYPTGTIREVFP